MNDNFADDEARIRQAEKEMEEEDWQEAKRFDTPESYRGYVDSYPHGLHTSEANKRIAELMTEQKERIIRALSEDRNAYHLNYIKACGITVDDLKGKIKDSKGQVRDEVLKSWDDIPEVLLMDTMPTHLPQGVPEVYVWGLPRSGKTCALTAIFSMANMMGSLEPCNGYAKELATLFIPKREKPAVCLPIGSAIDLNRYIPITLDEKVTVRKGRETIKRHDFSIIEISGDIFECFMCELMSEPFNHRNQEETCRRLKSYLQNTDNPKYHFFIIDSHPTQKSVEMLQRAAMYFRKSGIFNMTTREINLIVTKSDLLSSNRKQWLECAMHHVEHHYAFFANTLKRIVSRDGLGLTDGRLRVIPFSIGEVFFQDLCIFNPESAKILVDLLMCYADEGEKEWRWNKKGKWIRSFLKNGMGGIIDECISSIEIRGFSPKGKITMTRNYGFVLNDFGKQIVIGDNAEQRLIKFEPSTEFVSIAGTFKDEICLTAGGQIYTSRKGEDSFLDSDLMLYPLQFGSLCFFESISAGEGHILGVNYDGTAFCWDDWRSWEGVPDFKSMIKGWRNIKQVAVGYGNIIALTIDGKVLGSDEVFYKDYQDFIQVDAYGHYYGDCYSMALRRNGTVMSPNFEEISAWHDIVQIAVGWDAAVGLRRDGGVNIVFYDEDVVKEVSSWTNIVNIECKFSQIIAISSEGRIYNIRIH